MEDVTTAVQDAASSMDAPAPEDLPVQESVAEAAVTEAAPVEAAAEEVVAPAEEAEAAVAPEVESPVIVEAGRC